MSLESDQRSVLDHGYVTLVESWGSDERIIESARMSTNKGFQGWGTDARLLRYLWTHGHLTPFEMCGFSIEVQCPIFVMREWHRHRTQSYNELSARYTELPDMFYIPSIERLMAGAQSTKNKQGSEKGLELAHAHHLQNHIRESTEDSRRTYVDLIKSGLSRELARLVIPVNQYSKMRASANLRNWLAFMDLRSASGAQWEIRQYAERVGEIIAELFPRTWSLFKEGQDADNR